MTIKSSDQSFILSTLAWGIAVSFLTVPVTFAQSTTSYNAPVNEKPPVTILIRTEIDWTEERLKKEIAMQASRFGIEDQIHEMEVTVKCESDYIVTAHNKTDPYGGAHGVCQFLKQTFNKYAPLAGIKNPDITNPEHQIRTMAYMFSIGEAKQWTCWRKHFGQ